MENREKRVVQNDRKKQMVAYVRERMKCGGRNKINQDVFLKLRKKGEIWRKNNKSVASFDNGKLIQFNNGSGFFQSNGIYFLSWFVTYIMLPHLKK